MSLAIGTSLNKIVISCFKRHLCKIDLKFYIRIYLLQLMLHSLKVHLSNKTNWNENILPLL